MKTLFEMDQTYAKRGQVVDIESLALTFSPSRTIEIVLLAVSTDNAHSSGSRPSSRSLDDTRIEISDTGEGPTEFEQKVLGTTRKRRYNSAKGLASGSQL